MEAVQECSPRPHRQNSLKDVQPSGQRCGAFAVCSLDTAEVHYHKGKANIFDDV